MDHGPHPSVIGEASIRAFFKELLDAARAAQKLHVADGTEYYLVNLLDQFAASDRLFAKTEGGALDETPLVLLYQQAIEAQGPDQQRAFRRLGDVSLYTVGFLPDHVEHKAVDASYYAAMGREAYARLAQLCSRGVSRDFGFAGIYEELAARFQVMVELLNEVSDRLLLGTEAGVLRLYERFQRTGSARVARLLAERGMSPVLAHAPRGVQ